MGNQGRLGELSMVKFEEGKIRKLDPKGIIDEQTPLKNLELESFFLALGMIFNDIRGIVVLQEAFKEKYDRPDGTVSIHTGNYVGIDLQVVKYLASILHEALKLIESKKAIVTDDRFQRYYLQLSQQDKKIWSLILKVCGIEQPDHFDLSDIQNFRKLLLLIRNNISFHYDDAGKPLAKGFRKHFYGTAPGPANKSAMYSQSKTHFHANRYFYIDAALSGFLHGEYEKQPTSDVQREIIEMVIEISKVIEGLIEAYHKDKPVN